ncbi:hypothetical protein [Kangiella sediminilitoris]|uniref:Uncharacterized protein n=1 Tax=Kangiella sediminilitoris TaxID=1144748 RepID=A0A1B3B8Y1_9GAMM|nr:hypothetical protein [Kangiella sediminilitoris]AOE49258.1 hypothetical protein KS2013_534 [Kangiella sediminilitoris]
MSYDNFIRDPMLVAVASAFIGLLLALLYDKWKGRKDRTVALKLLKLQLESQIEQLDLLNDNLGENRILGGLDSFYIKNFLTGSSVDLSKDEKLISYLHEHLDNVELIKNAITRINMCSAGFTNVHSRMKHELESNLRVCLTDCKETIRKCISNT